VTGGAVVNLYDTQAGCSPGIGVQKSSPRPRAFDASVSVAWTFYAGLLLVIGFRLYAPILRYWALGAFDATIVKVIAYDLAFLDPIIKIVVVMALGSTMIGGGYIYIRSQKGKDVSSESLSPPQ